MLKFVIASFFMVAVLGEQHSFIKTIGNSTECADLTPEGAEVCRSNKDCVWWENKCLLPQYNLQIYYYVSCHFTIVSSLFVIITYCCVERLRRHPASFIVGRCIFDLLFATIFVILYWNKSAHTKCYIISPLLVFSLFGSNLYFIASSWNLRLNLKNPFKAETAYVKMSHFLVWVTATTLIVYTGIVHASAFRYDYQICWIRSYKSINPYLWTFVYSPVIIAIFYAWYVLVVMHLQLRNGLCATFAFRNDFLKECRVYTVTYSAYWTLAGICSMAVFYSSDVESSYNNYILLVILIPIVGVVDLVVWLYKFTRKVDYSENVNYVLRKEVLEHTMFGIHACVLEARNKQREPGVPSNEMYARDTDEN